MTTARSRGLGTEVRKLRKDADLRLEELAERCGWSRATLGRIESGDKVPTETEIAIILGTLGVRGKERERLLELAEGADQSHWWEAYSGLPAQLVALLDFERKASKMTDVSLALVPGLFQTPEYTRAIMSAGGVTGDALEARVALRTGRQGVLTRPKPVRYHAILDESVLRRPIGSSAVMAEQLRHIVRMARLPNITVQVIPFSVGAHLALDGSFLLMEFQRQRSIVHLEHHRAGIFVDGQADVSAFREALTSLTGVALVPDKSIDLISTRAASLEAHREPRELA